MLICLAYVSSARMVMTEASLTSLIEVSRRKNARLNVTGLLCYYENSFLQFLEGEQEAVEAVFEAIKADDRHTRVLELHHDPIIRRLFPDWTMGLRLRDQLSLQQQDICRDLATVRVPTADAGHHGPALELFLDSFRLSLH